MAAMAAILKIYFSLLLLDSVSAIDASWRLVDKNDLKSIRSEAWRHGRYLGNLFCTSSPEPKGQFIW